MTDEMQKARELALAVLLVGNAPPFEYYQGDTRWDVAMAKCKAENEATLDRYRASVRAETLREVRGVVEGMYLGIDTEIARGRVLDKLDALEEK
jgi:hypothetical protein